MKLSAGLISILILLSTFIGCSKLKVGSFVMPSWDTQLSAPIFDRTYTLGEILYKDSTTVSNGETTYITPSGPIEQFSLFSTQGLGGATFAGRLKVGSTGANYIEADSSIPVGQSAPAPAVPATKQSLVPDLPFQDFSQVTIDSGTLTLTVKNDYPAPIVFQNGIDVSDPSNNNLIFNIPLPGNTLLPNQSYTATHLLHGVTLPNDPVVSFTYSSPGSTSPVTFETDTVISVSFRMSDIVVSTISGQVHLKDHISLTTDTEKVSLGEFKQNFSGQVTFSDSTKLILNITPSGGFPSLVHLVVEPASSKIRRSPIDSAVVEQIVYPRQSNSISLGKDFIAALNNYSATYQLIPDEFIISGYIIVNPGPPYASGTLSENDKVGGRGTIMLPFDFGIANAAYTDTTKSHGLPAPAISDSSAAAKLGNVDSGRIVIEVNNGMPLEVSVTSQLIDTVTHQVVSTFPSDSIVIPAATSFNADGTVSSPVFSRNTIAITHDDAVNLGRCYMRYTLRALTSPNQQTVLFTKNNTVSLKVYANLTLRFDKTLVGK